MPLSHGENGTLILRKGLARAAGTALSFSDSDQTMKRISKSYTVSEPCTGCPNSCPDAYLYKLRQMFLFFRQNTDDFSAMLLNSFGLFFISL